MSLSRPVTFPLLKLPFLCIKCVIHNSDEFVLIFFATISNRTQRIVKASKFPPKEIDIHPNRSRSISIGDSMDWYFIQDTTENIDGKFALQRNSEPLRTCRSFVSTRVHYLDSYTAGDPLDALRMGIHFLMDVFGCKIRKVFVNGRTLSELFRIGISSVKKLYILDSEPFNITDLKYLLETIEVTDAYFFDGSIPKEFHCDPKIFKCRELYFGGESSADWVTLDILCKFGVPQLTFLYHRFSVEDIVSYVTHWFNSDNRKLKYLSLPSQNPISLEDFKIDHLNPMPFCEKRRSRWTLHESWQKKDMSRGKDILRKDGLLATFYVLPRWIYSYIWHKRLPDSV